MNNLVSIITPSYNCEKYIAETINSVLSQTYENWEMLIVDDCSTDNSIIIIEKFTRKDNRIKLSKNTNHLGISETRNKAIRMAKGKYIAFLDSDDLWLPQKLEKHITLMNQNNVALTYSAYEIINELGDKKGRFNPPKELTYTDLLKTCSIGCSTAIYNTHIIGNVYMPKIKKRQDYGLWLTIAKKGYLIKGLPSTLVKYRVHNKSISSNKINTFRYQWEIYRNFQKLSLIKSCYYFVHYAFYGFLKHKIYYRGGKAAKILSK